MAPQGTRGTVVAVFKKKSGLALAQERMPTPLPLGQRVNLCSGLPTYPWPTPPQEGGGAVLAWADTPKLPEFPVEFSLAVGMKHNSWRHFLERHPDKFAVFSIDDGKLRMRWLQHVNWQV